MQCRNLVKTDDDLLDGFRLDEASDNRVTADAERLVLGVVEDLVDESLQYEMELIISNLGDWFGPTSDGAKRSSGGYIQ